jgi:hypothetical protein
LEPTKVNLRAFNLPQLRQVIATAVFQPPEFVEDSEVTCADRIAYPLSRPLGFKI